MTNLPPSTLRRLQRLRKTNSVWEGDARPLPNTSSATESNTKKVVSIHRESVDEDIPHCVMWVDSMMGMVRTMEVMEKGQPHEILVRSLLQAIERPQPPAEAGLPKKILVRDRQLQFYLRGALQGLQITVEYVDQLPLLDEVYTYFTKTLVGSPPSVPPEQEALLSKESQRFYKMAPWQYLWDHQVIAVELNHWGIDTLYAIVMGRLGMERGVIFYRSEQSLISFRQRIVDSTPEQHLDQTFLNQDCIFNLFESDEYDLEISLKNKSSKGSQPVNVVPIFGTLHPLEGGRSFLYDEEALTLTAALRALNNFLNTHGPKFATDATIALAETYKITLDAEKITVKVKSLPKMTQLLESYQEEDEDEDLDDINILRSDLIPDGALGVFKIVPWEEINTIKSVVKHQQVSEKVRAIAPYQIGEGMPTFLVQTSKPKALEVIKVIESVQGVKGMCFNPVMDEEGNRCSLGLLIGGNDDIFVATAEMHDYIPEVANIRHKWQKQAKSLKGRCCLMVAMGITGATRRNPKPSQIFGYYEISLYDPEDLGIGFLRSIEID